MLKGWPGLKRMALLPDMETGCSIKRTASPVNMITILWIFAGFPAADTTSLVVFKDAGEISTYAGYAMAWAYESGIIAGKGNGIVDPEGIVTRAETAKILESYLNSRETGR